jgi:hypothetical protein
LYFERVQLTEMVRDFDARGFQVAIHAQGDRAIETVLDAYAAVLAGTPGNPRRHRIEHGGALYPPLAARAAALGIVVASQPGFMSTLGDGFAAAFGDRAAELYAFRSWRRAGITVAGSSDAPVITADPLLGLRDAVLRRTGDGLVLGPAERLPAGDALDLYTTQAAFAMHREGEIGTLEPGKLADIVLWHPAYFGAKPQLVLKAGFPAYGVVGDPNASTDRCEPLMYGPQFGGHGATAADLSVAFVAGAAAEAAADLFPTRRRRVAVRGTRGIGPSAMVRNTRTGAVRVAPATGAVTLDGEPIESGPSERVSLSRLYFL